MKEKMGVSLSQTSINGQPLFGYESSDHGRPKMQIYFYFDLNLWRDLARARFRLQLSKKNK